MLPRPSEPTSALAALIIGNHRHLERRASRDAVATADRTVGPALTRKPFALALARPISGGHAVTPHVFSAGQDEVMVVDAVEAVITIGAGTGVKLMVVIEVVEPSHGLHDTSWLQAEHRAFSTIETILRESAPLRESVVAGDLRVVAALLEHPSERLHWIGEHPAIETILRES